MDILGYEIDIYLVIVIITMIAWIADLVWKYLADVFFPYRRSRT